MTRLSIACAALAATLALAVRESAVAAQDFTLHGVNYNTRAGADWEPDATKCKSADVIKQELETLKRVTDTIRIYSLTDCNQGATVLSAAVKAGLKVSLGLWVGPEPATFAAEKAKFQELLAQDGLVNSKDVVGIHVGSEAVYRGDVNTTVAIANFDAIKQMCTAKGLSIPVSIADIGDVYLEHPELVDAVDVVSANAFPFWEKIDADKAAAYLYTRLEPLIEQAAAQNKEVIIGETGWATAGVNVNASAATPENAATYFRDFYGLAQQHQLKYFYFAGFDEQWKIATADANNTVEAYFGLFDKTGALKTEYKTLSLSNATATTPASPTMLPSPSSTEAALAPGTIHAGGASDSGASKGGAGAATASSKSGATTSNNGNDNSGTKQTVVVTDGKTSTSTSTGGASTTSGNSNTGTSSGSTTNPAKQTGDKRKDCAV